MYLYRPVTGKKVCHLLSLYISGEHLFSRDSQFNKLKPLSEP